MSEQRVIPHLTASDVEHACRLTERLTEIRANGCKHLVVENVAPDILHSILTRIALAKSGRYLLDEIDRARGLDHG